MADEADSADERIANVVADAVAAASRDAYIERLETGLLQVRKALCGDIHNTDDLLDLIASRDAEIEELVGVLGDVTAHLVAAHSLLSRGGKKAAASDTIFKIMLQDYEKSFEAGRKWLRQRLEE